MEILQYWVNIIVKHDIMCVKCSNFVFYMIKGASQMIMTTICGFIQLYLPCGMYKQPTQRSKRPPNFYIHMCLVGCTR